MHFVTGGAFNGKAKWVREYYQLANTPYCWISGYKSESLPETVDDVQKPIIILEGIEMWLKELAGRYAIAEAREHWKSLLAGWLIWEANEQQRKIILIGNDLNKGIVPIHAEERKWRDLTGWAYQDAVKACEHADIIWYGIRQCLK